MPQEALGLPSPQSGRRGDGSGVVALKDGEGEERVGRTEEGGITARVGREGTGGAELSGWAGVTGGVRDGCCCFGWNCRRP